MLTALSATRRWAPSPNVRTTRTARKLGMTRTVFSNASGLPNGEQRTTARDLARLASRLISDYPGYYRYFASRSFSYRGRSHPNHNRLLGVYPGMDGLKTGYTRASGFNLAASAVRDGRRLVAVVVGGRTAGARDAAMVDLLAQRHKIPAVDAYMLCSVCGDLRISEIVDMPNWVVSLYFPRLVLQ